VELHRLGTTLERGRQRPRMLDVSTFILLPSVRDIGTPYDDIQWGAVLKSVSGFEMYRKRYGRISPDRIVEFLSAGWRVPARGALLRGAGGPGPSTPSPGPRGPSPASRSNASACFARKLDYAQVEAVLKAGLHEFFDALEGKMNTIDECIRRDFFALEPVAAAPRASDRLTS